MGKGRGKELIGRPTTNLDQENINALAEALAEYVTSHGRRMRSVADKQDH